MAMPGLLTTTIDRNPIPCLYPLRRPPRLGDGVEQLPDQVEAVLWVDHVLALDHGGGHHVLPGAGSLGGSHLLGRRRRSTGRDTGHPGGKLGCSEDRCRGGYMHRHLDHSTDSRNQSTCLAKNRLNYVFDK